MDVWGGERRWFLGDLLRYLLAMDLGFGPDKGLEGVAVLRRREALECLAMVKKPSLCEVSGMFFHYFVYDETVTNS